MWYSLLFALEEISQKYHDSALTNQRRQCFACIRQVTQTWSRSHRRSLFRAIHRMYLEETLQAERSQ